MTEKIEIGMAVGRGTGAELAATFERITARLGDIYARKPVITRSPRTYDTYHSLLPELDVGRIKAATAEDAGHYEAFCRAQAARGVTAIFRTAINAQSLYLVRERLHAVKMDALDSGPVSLLLVRDQSQGFYTGTNTHEDDAVSRTFRFSKETTEKIVSFALGQARLHWGDEPPDRVLMPYKFHLFDGALSNWVNDISRRYGVAIELCQPDTANRNFLAGGLSGRLLVIGGNEWADIMHVVLLDWLGLGRQETRFTRNVYLHPGLSRLVEFQTVHGSADDLEGKDMVNPTATVRAAAAIMERHAGCAGAEERVEQALGRLTEQGLMTADMGGRGTTTSVVNALCEQLG
ncbi:isocitrate dehydrogenase [Amycolatopsis acidicola]|uniref:Isocitrate dehydrogenase n=1 Tax=Amycolatopsis acidicola TaxID=2596893 RepID=A0A5N0VMH9_9PSEU|nr:isocitrate/isopropylmalate family dehydrogenase [Amycolatopsis acidicola]KAA9166494.1 isocitrate dehydrogenase [Amycolatopsis acidicola]